jgi:hypothetical protein
MYDVYELIDLFPEAEYGQITDPVKQVIIEWSPLVHLNLTMALGVADAQLLIILLLWCLFVPLFLTLIFEVVLVFLLGNLLEIIHDVKSSLLHKLVREQ